MKPAAYVGLPQSAGLSQSVGLSQPVSCYPIGYPGSLPQQTSYPQHFSTAPQATLPYNYPPYSAYAAKSVPLGHGGYVNQPLYPPAYSAAAYRFSAASYDSYAAPPGPVGPFLTSSSDYLRNVYAPSFGSGIAGSVSYPAREPSPLNTVYGNAVAQSGGFASNVDDSRPAPGPSEATAENGGEDGADDDDEEEEEEEEEEEIDVVGGIDDGKEVKEKESMEQDTNTATAPLKVQDESKEEERGVTVEGSKVEGSTQHPKQENRTVRHNIESLKSDDHAVLHDLEGLKREDANEPSQFPEGLKREEIEGLPQNRSSKQEVDRETSRSSADSASLEVSQLEAQNGAGDETDDASQSEEESVNATPQNRDEEEGDDDEEDDDEEREDGELNTIEDGEFIGDTEISTCLSSTGLNSKEVESAEDGERKIFPCDACPKSFLAKHSLKRHVKEVHEGIRFQCPKCFECYTRMTSYNQHVCWANWRKSKARQAEKSKTPRAKIGRPSKSPTAATITTSGFECPACAESFPTDAAMRRHLMEMHEKLRYSCPVCGESYTRIQSYRKHRCGSSFLKAKLTARDQSLRGNGIDMSTFHTASAAAATFPGAAFPAASYTGAASYCHTNANAYYAASSNPAAFSPTGFAFSPAGSASTGFSVSTGFSSSTGFSAPMGSKKLFTQANSFESAKNPSHFSSTPTALPSRPLSSSSKSSSSSSSASWNPSTSSLFSANASRICPTPPPKPSFAPFTSSETEDSEGRRAAIVRQLEDENATLENLVSFIYSHYPPKDKRRFGYEDMNRFQSISLDSGSDSRKKLKQLLMKVLQDYHPDKVNADHGIMWAFICNEISKRLNSHFEQLK